MSEVMPVVEVRQVSKRFPGVTALDRLDLKIWPGEVTAITGENGAGKSTLMKIIAGVYAEYEGTLLIGGREVHFQNPRDAAGQGVAIIHQELSLVPDMTLTENIFLGRELRNRYGMLDYRKMNARAAGLLAMLHLPVDPAVPVNTLKVGQQQLVEIARALLDKPRVLIMDEPTSALSDKEVDLLFTIIRNLTAEGVAVLYISHKMNELFAISDRYAVLRDGALIGTGRTADISRDQLIMMMVGRKPLEAQAQRKTGTGKELLRVEQLSLRDPENLGKRRVDSVSFTLHEGEVLGICGLMGSGRTEILESLFGVYPKQVSGRFWMDGKEISIRSVTDAIAAGMALVPEDRKLQGLILNMNVEKNTSLASLDTLTSFGFIRKKEEAALSASLIRKMNTRVPDATMEVEKLSGGNQQKVVLSKWLAVKPRILLLDEPTRGIDVGAKAEMYTLIAQLKQEGMAILLVSSELPEILALSDRIAVMAGSRLTALFPREGTTEEMIMKAALVQHNP